MSSAQEIVHAEGLCKTFTLSLKDGLKLPVLRNVSFVIDAGEALALTGPSGSGKSTLMRMLYGNYRCETGSLNIFHSGTWVDMAKAAPRMIRSVRRDTIGYVSQFLRVIPRVPTLQIVAEPLRERGVEKQAAEDRAGELLTRLNISSELWPLSPVTFSGGEQQRVNIARGLCAPYPLLLLDEPTASLDAENRQIVIDLIGEARDNGSAIVGIFHDRETGSVLCTRTLDFTATRIDA